MDERVVNPAPSDTADGSADAEPPRCSGRGCRELAVVELRWRNPKLHDAARVKVWHACADHGDSLADFLARRGFLLERVDLGR